MRRIATWLTAGFLGLSLATSCGSSGSGSAGSTTTRPAPAASPADVDRALARAVAWSAANLDTTDAFTLAFADYVGRRYGITEARAGTRARPSRRLRASRPSRSPICRLVNPSARVAPAALTEQARPAFMLLRGGLACGDPGTPPDFESRLRAAIVAGDYDLTHAAFALGVERELGLPPDRRRRAPPGDRRRARARPIDPGGPVDDLAVERMAALAYLGGRVPPAAVRAIVAAQRRDGSFAAPDDGTQRHLGVFAVWALASAAPGRAAADPNAAARPRRIDREPHPERDGPAPRSGPIIESEPLPVYDTDVPSM